MKGASRCAPNVRRPWASRARVGLRVGLVLGLTAAALAGCTQRDGEADGPAPAPATPAPVAPTDDARDQYALYDAIMAARYGEAAKDPAILAKTRAAWIGKRYRWETGVQPLLCGDAGDCVVLPFDHSRRDEPMAQGWLPRLDLDAAARDALRERCAGVDGQCVVEFSGTLTQFELSNEQPTSLTFDEVSVERVRAAAPGESWVVSKRRAALERRIARAQRRQAARAKGRAPAPDNAAVARTREVLPAATLE